MIPGPVTAVADMKGFIEVHLPSGLGYINPREITWFGPDEWGKPIVVTGSWTHRIQHESLEEFKTRLRIAWSPAPTKGE